MSVFYASTSLEVYLAKNTFESIYDANQWHPR